MFGSQLGIAPALCVRVPPSNFLFVYGSLKRGEINFPVLARAGGRFVARGVTLRALPLLQGPRWRRLYDRPGVGERIAGEIFLVNSCAGWDLLDGFEGHPHGYRRRLEEVCLGGGRIVSAWIYFFVTE